MIEGKYLYGVKDDLSDVFEIRKKVYVEEEHLEEKYEFDGQDGLSIHALITVLGKKLGAGRLTYNGDEYRIGHIAILEEERGQGYGDFLVRMLIDKAFISGAETVIVGAKVDAVLFYKKMGFKEINEVYTDKAGIKRVDMAVNKITLCKECTNK